MITCTKCGLPQENDHFAKNKHGRFGRKSQCKSCVKKYNEDKAPERAATAALYRMHNPELMLWRHAKDRAQRKQIPFTITVDDVKAVWPPADICPVLKLPMEPHTDGPGPSDLSPTLDRFDPALGYVPGNIYVISHRANKLKSDVTDPRELELVAAWMRGVKSSDI